ncbi:hypothetical protein M885DRAFT_518428 [Pelagophyceae sp. CCMP2097]|nr:hypothetical protein M885DRAFT_518428 [Pelagophyceae sp. CCMP2097]
MTAQDSPAAGGEEQSASAWCHACADDVRAAPNADGELQCARCRGTFVEETERASRAGAAESLLDFLVAGASAVPEDESDDGLPQPPADLVASAIQQLLAQVLGAQAGGAGRLDALSAFQPHFLGGGGDGRLGGALGDYAVGNLSHIIEQLVANDSANSAVRRPANKAALARICTQIPINQSHVDEGLVCAIHHEPFSIGETATKLPCGHLFLDSAITTWLADHHSCPVCRATLPCVPLG